jgi:hypothetical protein
VKSCAPCALERFPAARAPVASECARVVSPVCPTRHACAVCACLHGLLVGVGGGRHLANVPWGDLGAVQVDRFPRVHRDQDRTGISAPADPARLTESPRTAGADEGRANGSLTCRSGRGGIAAADCGECWARPSTWAFPIASATANRTRLGENWRKTRVLQLCQVLCRFHVGKVPIRQLCSGR